MQNQIRKRISPTKTPEKLIAEKKSSTVQTHEGWKRM